MSHERWFFFRRKTHHTDPTPPVTSETSEALKRKYALSEEQRDKTFEESLHDYWRRFEAEEEARSVGERTRQNEFDRTMGDFEAIFHKNDLRRRELDKQTDALQEERFQKADAAREAIFAQGQKDRARAFEMEQEMRGKRGEWFNTARQGLLSEDRQRLKDKVAALNAALEAQFNRLIKSQKAVNRQASVTVEHFGQTSVLSLPSSPSSRVANTSIQPATTYRSDDDHSLSPPSSIRTLPPGDPRVTSQDPLDLPSSQSSSTESYPYDQQAQRLPYLTQQGNPEVESGQVPDDNDHTSFTHSQKQREETFLEDENERGRRFRASEAARDNRESKRRVISGRKINQWSRTWTKRGEIGQFRRREDERLMASVRRSIGFATAQARFDQVFDMSLSHTVKQAEAEADLEKIWFESQTTVILTSYMNQANQLAHARYHQPTSSYAAMLSTWLLDSIQRVMGRLAMYEEQAHEGPERVADPMVSDDEARPMIVPFTDQDVFDAFYDCAHSDDGLLCTFSTKMSKEEAFSISTIFSAGPLIQRVLPIPHNMERVGDTTHQRRDAEQMQRDFEVSQELRTKVFEKGASERNRIHTINEVNRGDEFVKAQQKRKEDFDEAEQLCESAFQDAQQRRETEFQANERKWEEDFHRDEMENNTQARREQEAREERFQSTMLMLQRNCVAVGKRRLEELEVWVQELMMMRE